MGPLLWFHPSVLSFLSSKRSYHITIPVHVRLKPCCLGLFWLGSKPSGIPLGTLCGWIVPVVPAKTRPLLWWVREAWKIHWTLHTALKPCLWAPVLKAVIWLQRSLTVKIDEDSRGWGLSQTCRWTCLSPYLPSFDVGLQLFQGLQFLHLPFSLIDVGADGLHGLQSLLHRRIICMLLGSPL